MTDTAPAITSTVPTHLTVLDAMRGLAVLAVILVHTGVAASSDTPPTATGLTKVVLDFTFFGRYGVELFFALSGFLMFTLYYGKPTFRARAYWARRLTRLWPLWIVFSIVGLVLSLFRPETDVPWWVVLGAVSVFLGWLIPGVWNFPPGGWSINAEVGNYLLFAALRRRRPKWFLTSVLVLYPTKFAASWLLAAGASGPLATFLTGWLRLGFYATWPFFVVGGFLALVWRERDRPLALLTRAATPWTVAQMLAIMALFVQVPGPAGSNMPALATCVMLAAIGAAANQLRHAGPALRSAGRVSYFMYFAHFYVLTGLAALFTGGSVLLRVLVFYPVAVGTSWAAGQLSRRWFEGPILQLGRRI
jgi:peptidoglycan/LPS O-acetylase OafA/YrhL